jgi:hypothetical protein
MLECPASRKSTSMAYVLGTPAEEDLRSSDAEAPGVSGSNRKDDPQ